MRRAISACEIGRSSVLGIPWAGLVLIVHLHLAEGGMGRSASTTASVASLTSWAAGRGCGRPEQGLRRGSRRASRCIVPPPVVDPGDVALGDAEFSEFAIRV